MYPTIESIIKAGLTYLADTEGLPEDEEFALIEYETEPLTEGGSWTDATFKVRGKTAEIGFYWNPEDNTIQSWWYDTEEIFNGNEIETITV